MRGRIRGFAYRNRSRAVSASLSLSLAFTFCSRTIIPNHDDFVEECLEPATAGKLTSAEANVPQVA
jgi:hypothetical protein